jgi:hypothetical protein
MPVSPVPQKILREGAGGTNLGIGMGANHLRMIGTTISGVAAAVGSVVHAVAVDKGMFVDPMDEKIICYLAWGMLNYAVPNFTSNSLYGKDVFYDAGLLSDPNWLVTGTD